MENEVYYIEDTSNIYKLQTIFENPKIKKIGYKLKEDYILLKQIGMTLKGFYYDIEIAGYIIDAVKNKYDIEILSLRYLNLEIARFIDKKQENKQLDIFSMSEEKDESKKDKTCIYVYCINKLYKVTKEKIKEQGSLELFEKIEMPTAEVLAKMQYTGIYVDKEELVEFGRGLKLEIEEKTNKIYQLCRTRI